MYEEYKSAEEKINELLNQPGKRSTETKKDVTIDGKTYSKFIPSNISLKRIKKALELLGVDLNNFEHIFHITGTSGKGSICNILHNSFTKDNIPTGLYTSPHLYLQIERIKISGSLLSPKEYVATVNLLLGKVNPSLEKIGFGSIRYLEALFIIAVYSFFKHNLKTLIIEVGMGGFGDYTNIFDQKKICMISNVSYDHIEKLGPRLEDIAFNKAGIITPKSTVITGVSSPYYEVIEKIARANDASLYIINKDFNYEINEDILIIHLHDKKFVVNLPPKIVDFQIKNFVLSFIARYLFDKRELQLSEGLLSIPGRFEVVSSNPLVIIDGAHNVDKMNALVQSFRHIYKDIKPVVILGFSEGHGTEEMVKIVSSIASSIVITHPINVGSKSVVDENIIKKYLNIKSYIEKDPVKAVDIGIKLAEKQNIPLLITGSMYLIGESRKIFYPPFRVLEKQSLV